MGVRSVWASDRSFEIGTPEPATDQQAASSSATEEPRFELMAYKGESVIVRCIEETEVLTLASLECTHSRLSTTDKNMRPSP